MDFAVWWNISLTTQPDGNVIKVGKVMTLIGGRQSELVLENVKREDLGAFTCLAKNSLGEASALLILPGDFLCTSSSIVCTWGNATSMGDFYKDRESVAEGRWCSLHPNCWQGGKLYGPRGINMHNPQSTATRQIQGDFLDSPFPCSVLNRKLAGYPLRGSLR